MIHRYLEPLITEVTQGKFYAQVYQAKEEFFEKTGRAYEDDPFFEARMALFLEWYLFDRDLPDFDMPPVVWYFQKHESDFNAQELKIYRDFCFTKHSLFQVKRFSLFRKSILLRDLFTRKTEEVKLIHQKIAFSKGDVFEGRLILFLDHQLFGEGFCFHPVEVKSFILSEVKKIRSHSKLKQLRFIFQLASMHWKHLKFPHVEVQHVYRYDSKFI